MKRTALKRSEIPIPLRRKTPLAQREPLKQSSPLARNTRLKPRSDATAKLYREERVPLVARLLEERPECEMKIKDICTGRSVDCHEIVSRARGGDILDEKGILCCCRPCHTFVTDHPVFAQVMGFSKHSWERDGPQSV